MSSRTVLIAALTGVLVSAEYPASGLAEKPLPPMRTVTAAAAAARAADVLIPAGSYLPLYAEKGVVRVPGFRLDVTPVTEAQYAGFMRRGGDAAAHSGAPAHSGVASGSMRPVTKVTRAAARAYCQAQGKRLPTTDEWELAAAASATSRRGTSDASFRQQLLDMYTRKRATGSVVGRGFTNVYGVKDMHGLVWEWTEASHDHAHHGATKHDMSCAGSAQGASTTLDYAAFMRYAFRSGLTDSSAFENLGFRCARSV